MPIVSLLAEHSRRVIQEPFPSHEQIWAIGAALFAVWLFAVGASVGSFLNVVVYRLPLGLSLSNPGSRCPRCLHPIRLHHNIPILGWLLLRGRCADCQLPISPRYPRVEFLLGMIFLIVGGVELIGNGVNFPRPAAGLTRNVLSTQDSYALGAAATMHLILLSTLVCAALIEFDGQFIPRRIAVPVILLAIFASLRFPALHPIPALDLLNTTQEWQFAGLPELYRGILQSRFLDLMFGGVAGIVAAALFRLAFRSRPWLVQRYGEVFDLLWFAIGLVFGWQLLPLLLALWAALQVLQARTEPEFSLRPVRDLALVTLPVMLGWRWIAGYPQVIDASLYGQAAVYAIVLFIAVILLFIAAARLPRDYIFPEPTVDEAFQPTPAPLPTTETTTDVGTIETSLPSPDEPSHS
jgi:leader peptidase (prepilin peptidase)/N-methyltransferase